MSLDDARQRATPCAELSGAQQFPLGGGGRARIELNDLALSPRSRR